ncbi:hypothetical protein M0R04_09345 [Candidatus Dojkabacteria bacterium]|jgi:hypothetical protein|nr:hypothetical protein [Candidatus Dojkabacteria bacterium]
MSSCKDEIKIKNRLDKRDRILACIAKGEDNVLIAEKLGMDSNSINYIRKTYYKPEVK